MKIKFVSVLLSVVFIVSSLSFAFALGDEIAINSYDDLVKISDKLDGNYILKKDITAPKNADFLTIGSNSKPFTGTLDGNGHSIFGISINSVKESQTSYCGFFANNKGVIKNLNIEDAVVNGGIAKYSFTGTLAAVNHGTIENCLVSGKAYNKDTAVCAYTGTVTGQQYVGSVSGCSSYMNIYSYGPTNYTGGICGSLQNGNVSRCEVYGSLFSNSSDGKHDSYSGGIVGVQRNKSKVFDCAFYGGIIGEKSMNVYLGGIIGLGVGFCDSSICAGNLSQSEIISHIYISGICGYDPGLTSENCYYSSDCHNEEDTGYSGKKLSPSEMKTEKAFDGLDFNNTWEIKDGLILLKNMPSPNKKSEIAKLTGVKIIKKPTVIKYKFGDDKLNLTGLKVVAQYSDGTTAVLKNNDFTVGGYNPTLVGNQVITVNYFGFTDTFTVKVKLAKNDTVHTVTITDGAYIDGNLNGQKSPKVDGNNSTDEKTDTKQNGKTVSDNSSKTGNNGNTDVSSKQITSDKNSSISSDKGNEKNEESSSNIFIIVAIILLAVIILVVLLALVIKKKSSLNEIGNDDVSEVSHDENDIY